MHRIGKRDPECSGFMNRRLVLLVTEPRTAPGAHLAAAELSTARGYGSLDDSSTTQLITYEMIR
jgi:hypothetical protein